MNDSTYAEHRQAIEAAWEKQDTPPEAETLDLIRQTIGLLDTGRIRVAVREAPGQWKVNQWIKQAILLYFRHHESRAMSAGDLQFYDKIPLKGDYDRRGIRAVPAAVARWGSYVAPGVVLMPCYVIIGAYVDQGTLIDTWSTVGSCAQVGQRCHISGGVGIGGVLEPVQAAPVIIEDNVFLGADARWPKGSSWKKGRSSPWVVTWGPRRKSTTL
jgi:2,3,4,5-tetrahydropyridine-2-carboxylate N-succinyltransferase